jgi:hypothetical protein
MSSPLWVISRMIFSFLGGETPGAGKDTDGLSHSHCVPFGGIRPYFIRPSSGLEKAFLKASRLKRDKACPKGRVKTEEEIKEDEDQKKKAQKQVFHNRFAQFALGDKNNNQKEDGFIGNPDTVAGMNPDFFVYQE